MRQIQRTKQVSYRNGYEDGYGRNGYGEKQAGSSDAHQTKTETVTASNKHDENLKTRRIVQALMPSGPLSGKKIGNNYQLGKLLGKGKFGSVYRARNEQLNRTEAIKIVVSSGSNDPEWQQRFMCEAQMLAKLEHPNIIPIYDYGFDTVDTDKKLLYLAMQFADGGTLENILEEKQGPLSLKDIEHFLQQICSALDFAHTQGIAHLDLKPTNLLLQREKAPTLLLSDFRLAYLVEKEKIEDGTSPGFGTPHYMAPEQSKGEPQSASDIYALGVILYRMLTGQLPYTGDSRLAIQDAHLQAPIPRISAIRSDLPAALDQVIITALAKNPAERFQNADSLLKSFQAAIVSSPPKLANRKPLPEAKPARDAPDPTNQPAGMVNEPAVGQNRQPSYLQPKVSLSQPRPGREFLLPQREKTPAEKRRAFQEQVERQSAYPQLNQGPNRISGSLQPKVSLLQPRPSREFPLPLQKKTSAEKRQAFINRIYPSADSSAGIWLSPFFFLTGLGAIIDTYAQYQPTLFTLIVMGAIALLSYYLVYRKTTSVLTFVLVSLFSGVMLFLLSEKVHLFPIIQQPQPVQTFLWPLGVRDFWVMRQVNAGLIIGGILAFILCRFFKRSIGIVFFSLIPGVLVWLIVSILATIFNWGFGFGDGWYFGLLYQPIGVIAAIGLVDFLNILPRRFE
jgi:serine/threonine protein kinase